jgi:hypothetical protein
VHFPHRIHVWADLGVGSGLTHSIQVTAAKGAAVVSRSRVVYVEVALVMNRWGAGGGRPGDGKLELSRIGCPALELLRT